jgi:acetylornithine deacetylase/succinyl-diaminopimelate desuccinylase-like protein
MVSISADDWQYSPFEGTVAGSYPCGRGVSGMKIGIAMIMLALVRPGSK